MVTWWPGRFSTLGGVSANNISRWNGSTWSPLGLGVNNPVSSLTTLPDGDVVAVGAVIAARWNGSVWSPLGSGSSGSVPALITLPNGDIVAGGNFSTAEGATRLATYSFDALIPTILAQPQSVSACSGNAASFSVTAETGTLTYQWQLQTAPNTWSAFGNDPLPLPCGGSAQATPPDTATISIHITPCPGTNHYLIRCLVSNSCGSATTDEATLTINSADFNGDGDPGADTDIDAFFACLGGNCCPSCGSADFNGDGDTGTDADIDSFFRVLAGGPC